MAVSQQGKVTTTMGLKEYRAPECAGCHQRKDGEIYSRDANGQMRCEDCASVRNKEILAGAHDDLSEG